MSRAHAFGVGILGALVVYALHYRDTRIADFLEDPARNWKELAFDLVIYFVCGGLVAAYFVEPKSDKEAFMGGAAWEGLAGGLLAQTAKRRRRR